VNIDLGPEVAEEVRPYLPLAEQLGRAFVGLARGMPARLAVRAEGRLGGYPVRPLALGVLKGALSAVSADKVSYVNAPLLARSRGLQVSEEAFPDGEDFLSLLRVSGEVGGETVAIAGSLVGRKGPCLVEAFDYQLELPLSSYLLVVRNEDVPGIIGLVGTYLGELGVNIADMVVGRSPEGKAAMMGISLDQPIADDQLEGLRALRGITDATFVDLS
jgi:D-3-phosphoglycerate dehydrogenase